MKRWTIGNRGKRQADLGLEDNTVSALHASLTQTDDGRWVIEDRNSTNGTARIVNGQWVRIRQAIVQPDERLRFGRAETTVRQLLQLPRDAGSVAGSSATVRWNQDLALAFSEIRSFSELKKNILFVMDLLSAPTRQIMRCAMRRRPVNPFSFMLFGGLIYTVITASGLSITSALNLQGAKEQSEFLENVLSLSLHVP